MKFSLIIPVYNVAPYLCDCLDSIVSQTFHDWEAICVDDGSSDDSGQILDEYAANDQRFKVIHKNNEGVSVARNTAIEIASGDYIGFVDADDVITSDWLIHAHNCIETSNADVVRFEMQRWNGGKHEAPVWSGEYKTINDRKELVEWGWSKYLSDNCGGPCNVFARRYIVREYGKFPLGMRMKEDRIFLLRLLMNTKKMVCCDYQGYFYRSRSDSACSRQRKVTDVLRYMAEIKNLAMEFQNEIQKSGAELILKRSISWTLINDIEELMSQGKIDEWRSNCEIPNRLSEFRKSGLLLIKYVRPRYIPAVLCALLFGSMKGFVANREASLLYRKIHSQLKNDY